MTTQVTNSMLSFDGGAFSFRNKIINGGCQVAQRGDTATTQSAAVYGGCDRIVAYMNFAGASTATSAQQGVTWTKSGYAQGCINATGTGGGGVLFRIKIESKDTLGMQGQTATFSCKIYHDVGSSINASTSLYRPTSTADVFSAVTAIQTSVGTTAIPNTTATTFTYTFSAADMAYANVSKGLQLDITVSTGNITSKNVLIGDLQFESGSVPTPMEIRPYQTELALCQRYYYREASLGGAAFAGSGIVQSATVVDFLSVFPVPLRIAPTALEQSGTATDYRTMTTALTACSAVPTFQGTGSIRGATSRLTVASGLTAGQSAWAGAVNSSAYLGWSAEL